MQSFPSKSDILRLDLNTHVMTGEGLGSDSCCTGTKKRV